MRFAINRAGFIENIIISDPEQKEELESSLHAILEDASIYGLQIGDLWVEGKGWTRNIDGEQISLEPLTQEEWCQYQDLVDQVTVLEKENAALLFENLTGEVL